MKRLIVTAVGTVALMAGTAYAGGGCDYGSHVAADKADTPELASVDENNPELLARLKKQEEMESLEKLLETAVTHN